MSYAPVPMAGLDEYLAKRLVPRLWPCVVSASWFCSLACTLPKTRTQRSRHGPLEQSRDSHYIGNSTHAFHKGNVFLMGAKHLG